MEIGFMLKDTRSRSFSLLTSHPKIYALFGPALPVYMRARLNRHLRPPRRDSEALLQQSRNEE
jgi:hypothetical protein